jgi:hypothetical protein
LILLLDIAYLHGVNLPNEFNKKMLINSGREWTERQGTLKHT